MRILLLNPNTTNKRNWGHQLFKNEIGKHHNVNYYGEGYPGFDPNLSVKDIILNLNKKFDLILLYEIKYSKLFKGLEDIVDIPKVLIQIDYAVNMPATFRGFCRIENIDPLIKRNKINMIFTSSTLYIQAFKNNLKMDSVFLLPFSVDINHYKNMNLKRYIDAMAVFTTRDDVYPNRKNIQTLISKMKINSFTQRVIHNNYIRKLNESKLFIVSNNKNKNLSMKYTEAMACGALVLAEEPEDLSTQGFIEGEHLILYEGLKDLKRKILYYLNNPEERNEIATNGMNFVRENHSCYKRVCQFTEIIKKELKI